ncbi:bifunctional diguanylate cyclase/phosphodiesterase [Sphingomonas sinipercae]|uniref:Bifunctional diguanylate cyclase/phosphodiesterase n=1 Tax=Sphingomonas sinipercae TaxID=2714944 RepID=A0A6G7ZMW5_9SPHN|nr:bifunctional diguanylate cyclase/phosphodiesterase [Sphingomonas sinipercae]QIL02321.1 bifunctional diguanylate cyclase/phosphodiesterase [Sphingomonas sinipercae]
MQPAFQRFREPTRARPAGPNANAHPAAGDDEALLSALPIAAGIFSLRGEKLWIHGVNDRFFKLAGCAGAPERFVSIFRHYAAGPGGDFIRNYLKSGGDACDEMEFDDGDGPRRRFMKMKLAPLRSLNCDEPRCLISVVDRTVEVQAEHALRAEMVRDSLTGLANRLGFTETIEKVVDASVKDAEHAVLVVDLLRFSRINESMGSIAGDELLITFARRLMSALRGGDVLARTGGNEFGILVALGRGAEDALAAADRIQQVMSAPFTISDLEIQVECAIGLALIHAGDDAEDLFRNAQFAVKQAKQSGRPQIYEPKEASLARRRFSVETELRRALDRDQLRLFYQPLIDLKSGKVAGFEALARWTHEDRGEISPSEFIPVAEESGLILQLGRWALDKATQTLAGWDREAGGPLPIYVGVNLSAIQVARDDVAGAVAEALRSSGLAGNRLTLELTESSIVQDPGRATRVFDALKALDTTVAMDDFGTGYSSLAYLQRLPIDVLKIDRSFVSAMMVDPDSVAIVRAVLSLAEALGMSTTAEGIESVELATTLAALGCASGQGFYFARPLEAEAAADYWKTRRR